jgi:hypothetical protein
MTTTIIVIIAWLALACLTIALWHAFITLSGK